MDNGHYAPEGISFFQEEESNGRQSVETLAVADVLIVPAECYKHTSEFVDLPKKKRKHSLNQEVYIVILWGVH